MELYNQIIEFDKEGKKVAIKTQIDGDVVATFTYDGEENTYQVFGELKSVLNYKDTEEDNEKYTKALEGYAFLCRTILEQNK